MISSDVFFRRSNAPGEESAWASSQFCFFSVGTETRRPFFADISKDCWPGSGACGMKTPPLTHNPKIGLGLLGGGKG